MQEAIDTQELEQELINLDNYTKEAQEQVKLGDALERLLKNRDFKKVILDGYFEEEAVRLVMAKSNPSLQDEFNQAVINKGIDGVGLLRQFFERIQHGKEQAVNGIIAADEAREDVEAQLAAEQE